MSEEITREELENALRTFTDNASEDLATVRTVGIASAAAVGIAAVGAAYYAGRRRKHSEKTYVEIQRVS